MSKSKKSFGSRGKSTDMYEKTKMAVDLKAGSFIESPRFPPVRGKEEDCEVLVHDKDRDFAIIGVPEFARYSKGGRR